MTVLPPKETVVPDSRQSGALVAANPGLSLEIVDSMAWLAALRPAWESLEQRDPEGTEFLSWAWLAEAFRTNPSRWRVLSFAGSGSQTTAFAYFRSNNASIGARPARNSNPRSKQAVA